MRSQLCVVMHPEDEAAFLAEVLRDFSVQLINGPRWKSSSPVITRNIFEIGFYCLIWSPDDLPILAAEYIPQQNDWYCRSEFATIQFLRCSIKDDVISDGRIAVSTWDAPVQTAEAVERRYKQLRKSIKKEFRNSVVHWQNTAATILPAGLNRSANPSNPDKALWVGPAALKWLASSKRRCIKQSFESRVEGRLIAQRD